MSSKKEEFKKTEVAVEEVLADESVEETIEEVEEDNSQLTSAPAVPEKDAARNTETFKGRVVKCDKLNIRKAPSFNSEIIGTLDKGKVEQFTTTAYSAWYAFSYGFVSSNFIERV